jgi:hypothetical protein
VRVGAAITGNFQASGRRGEGTLRGGATDGIRWDGGVCGELTSCCKEVSLKSALGRAEQSRAEQSRAEKKERIYREAGRRGVERWDQSFGGEDAMLAAPGCIDAGRLVSGGPTFSGSRAIRTPSASWRVRRREIDTIASP